MIGKQDRGQRTLFIPGDIEDLVPPDHILKRVDGVLDLSWLRKEVEDTYCLDNGRPGIDPEAAVRLMLAGFFQGIVHDRKLMREAQVNIAIRWFAGFQLHEKVPHHSALTRIRQRWGVERFRRIFERTVKACIDANLVSGDTVHVDSTLVRADVSWESLTIRHADRVVEENSIHDQEDSGNANTPKKLGRPRKHPKQPKKYSKTDPDATLSTANKKNRMEPTYKQHTVSDDRAGVIVDVELTTGEVSEGNKLVEVVDRTQATMGRKIERLTADMAYAHPRNYQALEERDIDPVIPAKQQRTNSRGVPLSRFKYDAKNEIVTCPAGKKLHKKGYQRNGWNYSTSTAVCQQCPLCQHCVPSTVKHRTVRITDGYEALTRARRRKLKGWDDETKLLYKRHKWRVEGAHGEAKTQHGLRRAVRRGIGNVAIQVYLTAAVMNLKRLAALLSLFYRLTRLWERRAEARKSIFRDYSADYVSVSYMMNDAVLAA